VADAVREAVRLALASAGYVRAEATAALTQERAQGQEQDSASAKYVMGADALSSAQSVGHGAESSISGAAVPAAVAGGSSQPGRTWTPPVQQPRIEFPKRPPEEDSLTPDRGLTGFSPGETARGSTSAPTQAPPAPAFPDEVPALDSVVDAESDVGFETDVPHPAAKPFQLPPLNSAEKFAREVSVESLSANIRPLGQLDDSFIIATDDEGLLLIDQHVAHERILFDKYRALESNRAAESQNLLIPETFDLTPAQVAAFDLVVNELESYGFDLMRLSGRTVAIKAVPADLPAGEARNMLAEILDTVDAEKKGSARENLRDEIAASLACHAAIKVNMPLAPEKMRWLIDRLLTTSSPTTCPHGRPVILRLSTRDILKGFHRI
jgi:DNA mismatch repair ATPase MutL